jgi:hypothetical protein
MIFMGFMMLWVFSGVMSAFWIYYRLHILLFTLRKTHKAQRELFDVILDMLRSLQLAGALEVGLVMGLAWVVIVVVAEAVTAFDMRLTEIRRRVA